MTLIENRLKVLRAERDWTQADLAAEAFGVSIDQVFAHKEDTP